MPGLKLCIRKKCLQLLLLNIVRQLQLVHEQGVIMNDVKEDNMVFQSRGAFLVDFGMAHYGDMSVSCTQQTEEETHEYRERYPQVDPDAMRKKKVSRATDVFSLGLDDSRGGQNARRHCSDDHR